jgi:AcrR family transcriptional regulator
VDDRIRAAAAELMAEGGYEAVTIAGVARRAGLPRSTIYRRHPSQFSLRYSTLVLPAGGLPPPRETGDIATDMRDHIRANATAFRDPAAKALTRSITIDILSDEDGRRTLAEGDFLPRLAAVAEVIERARDLGDLPARCDPEVAATAITGTLIYHALILGQPVDDAFLDRLTALLFSP